MVYDVDQKAEQEIMRKMYERGSALGTSSNMRWVRVRSTDLFWRGPVCKCAEISGRFHGAPWVVMHKVVPGLEYRVGDAYCETCMSSYMLSSLHPTQRDIDELFEELTHVRYHLAPHVSDLRMKYGSDGADRTLIVEYETPSDMWHIETFNVYVPDTRPRRCHEWVSHEQVVARVRTLLKELYKEHRARMEELELEDMARFAQARAAAGRPLATPPTQGPTTAPDTTEDTP